MTRARLGWILWFLAGQLVIIQPFLMYALQNPHHEVPIGTTFISVLPASIAVVLMVALGLLDIVSGSGLTSRGRGGAAFLLGIATQLALIVTGGVAMWSGSQIGLSPALVFIASAALAWAVAVLMARTGLRRTKGEP